jgi:hypothetical protein
MKCLLKALLLMAWLVAGTTLYTLLWTWKPAMFPDCPEWFGKAVGALTSLYDKDDPELIDSIHILAFCLFNVSALTLLFYCLRGLFRRFRFA